MKLNPEQPKWLKLLSKITCLSTLILIFVGGMVTSTGSGLAVPDWPLSYGTLFPPMVGGVFYEHGHRMVATAIGFMMLCLAVFLGMFEKRRWVKNLGFIALGMVILQGVLGGMTVLFFLPTPISVFHGVLAQTFFMMTIMIAYSLSNERKLKQNETILEPHALRGSTPPVPPTASYFKDGETAAWVKSNSRSIKLNVAFVIIVYIQLILGAIMRHTHSGLAIPDFPTMGGAWIPLFNEQMLMVINEWRFDRNLDPVGLGQVWIHFIHRIGAVFVALFIILLTKNIVQTYRGHPVITKTVLWILFFVCLQILLGMGIVLTQKAPRLTSVHVANGAAILGGTVLLLLRIAPVHIAEFKRSLWS